MEKEKMIKITTDDKVSIVEVDIRDPKMLRDKIGGYVEVVHTMTMRNYFRAIGESENTILLVDEDGILKELPYNRFGSLMYPGHICGDVLIGKIKGNDVAAVEDAERMKKKLVEDFRFLKEG